MVRSVTIKEIHKTTLFSIEKILSKHHLSDRMLHKNEKWIKLQWRLEEIRQQSDYFQALRFADMLIIDVKRFVKDLSRKGGGPF